MGASLATDPRFDHNAARNEHRAALRELIQQTFAPLTTAQVLARLDEAQIANARMNDMAGLWAHPQLAARDRWAQVDTQVGKIAALLPPGRNNAYDHRMDPIPAVGEHTEAILREAGLSDADISTLSGGTRCCRGFSFCTLYSWEA